MWFFYQAQQIINNITMKIPFICTVHNQGYNLEKGQETKAYPFPNNVLFKDMCISLKCIISRKIKKRKTSYVRNTYSVIFLKIVLFS